MSTQDSDLVTRVNAIVNDSISKSIPMSTSLLEAGVDSLSAVEIRRNLEESMGTDLPATVVFDYPTVVDIARYIGSLMKSPISKVSNLELKKEERESSVIIDSYSMKIPHCCASLSALCDALLSKKDTVQVTPSSRWDVLTYSSLHSNGTVTVPFASFLHDIYSWDCAKYSVGAREALHIDPQCRIALDVALPLVISQEYSKVDAPNVGVYIGSMWNDYTDLFPINMNERLTFSTTGNGMSFTVGRISYMYCLVGPCIAVDTACSSSLVALHTGISHIGKGDCEHALIGGVNAILTPSASLQLSQLGALSPSGRCQTLSNAADGYGRGEGFATLAMSPCDGSDEWQGCVILASAVNHDGRSSGLTAPHGPSQESLIERATFLSGREVPNFFSLHGTGTMLGDPIEVGALCNALQRFYVSREDRPSIVLGAIKSAIAHTESTAGVAGMLMSIMTSQQRQLLPLHFRGLNPYVTSAMRPFEGDIHLPTQTSRGIDGGVTCGASSFGMSGTNAHAVLSGGTNLPGGIGMMEKFHCSRVHPLNFFFMHGFEGCSMLRSQDYSVKLSVGHDLWQHIVHGLPIFPAAGYLDLGIQVLTSLCKISTGSSVVESTSIAQALPLRHFSDRDIVIQLYDDLNCWRVVGGIDLSRSVYSRGQMGYVIPPSVATPDICTGRSILGGRHYRALGTGGIRSPHLCIEQGLDPCILDSCFHLNVLVAVMQRCVLYFLLFFIGNILPLLVQ